ncbi:protein kinase [Streptomyces sp. NPDC047028]|uniref:serine/threonine-protein kinase n=1 Tax=Streptomyces sp. NPDC047028 TaxID=3155793 RepID=UPI00340FE8B2
MGELIAGRYRLGERLGAGGMGEVWAARDERMRRDVAVKLVHPSYGARQSETRDRFQREVELAARLSHQNIVTVHDWGDTTVDGSRLLYLVMELLAGTPLNRRFTQDRTPWPLGVGWAAQIAQALDEAHRHGVVHRDIKPANAMVISNGTVKVLDFGLAKFVGDTVNEYELTATGSVLGSPSYMSPEQAEGDRDIDHRTDLYSLGCLLYEAVAKRPPFVATSPLTVLRMHMDTVPQPLSNRLPAGVPPALDDLVLRLLAKDPDDRPADAMTLAEELIGLLIEAAPPSPGRYDLVGLSRLGLPGALAQRVLDKAFDEQFRRRLVHEERLRNERAEAEQEAARIRARAEADARELRAAAQEEAERILAAARTEAGREHDAAPEGLSELRSEYDRMSMESDTFIHRLRLIDALLDDGKDPDSAWRNTAASLIEETEHIRSRVRHEQRGLSRLATTEQRNLNAAQVTDHLSELRTQYDRWRLSTMTLARMIGDGERLLNAPPPDADGPPPVRERAVDSD